MAILTVNDKDVYFPDVDLSGNSLLSAIASAQMLVESRHGADRRLEITKYVENREVHSSATVQLTYYPIVVSEVYPVKVEIRWMAGLNTPSNLSGVDEWQELTANDYDIDTELNELKLNTFFSGFSRFSTGSTYGSYYTNVRQRRKRVEGRYQAPQVRITYYAGYDFTQDDYNTTQIKVATGNIINFKGSSTGQALATGLKNYTLENFYTVGYDSNITKSALSKDSNSVIEENLAIIRKYRPREFFR